MCGPVGALRIPAEWVSKAMRCKHCKKSFQAKANGSKSANEPLAASASSAKKSAPIPTGPPANAAPAADLLAERLQLPCERYQRLDITPQSDRRQQRAHERSPFLSGFQIG